MGRKKKADIEREKTRNILEEQLEKAIDNLETYGNTSLGLKIVNAYSVDKASKILSDRTGRDIYVFEKTYPGPVIQGKRYPDDIYYIAEDKGPKEWR